MIDSNRMTANNLDAKPTMHAIPKTRKTNKDFDPAGFIMFDDPLLTATDVDVIVSLWYSFNS
jgi:hypothetical protein